MASKQRSAWKWLLAAAVILYFAIAAYGRSHKPPLACTCDSCTGECYTEMR